MSIRKGNSGKKKKSTPSNKIIASKSVKQKHISDETMQEYFYKIYGKSINQISRSVFKQGLDWDDNGNLYRVSKSERRSEAQQGYFDPFTGQWIEPESSGNTGKILLWLVGIGVLGAVGYGILTGKISVPEPQVQPTPRPPFKATDSLSAEAKEAFKNKKPNQVIIDPYTDFRIENNLFGE